MDVSPDSALVLAPRRLASRWHFSPITTTVVFGTYAIAVLAALLVLGRMSDPSAARRSVMPHSSLYRPAPPRRRANR